MMEGTSSLQVCQLRANVGECEADPGPRMREGTRHDVRAPWRER